MPTNTNIQSITLSSGQTAWIPINAQIIGIGQSEGGDVTAESTCIDLTPAPNKCYVLTWETAGAGLHAPLNDAYFSKIILGSLVYEIPANTCYYEGSTDHPVGPGIILQSWVNTEIPAGIMSAPCLLQDSNDGSSLAFEVAGTMPIPQIEISNPTGQSIGIQLLYMYMIEATGGECDCHP